MTSGRRDPAPAACQSGFGEEVRLVVQGWNAPGIVMHPTGGLVMYIGTIPFPEITRAASVP